MIVFENKKWCIESKDEVVYITNAVSAETVDIRCIDGNPLRAFCPKLESWNRLPKSIRKRALKELDRVMLAKDIRENSIESKKVGEK